MDWKYKQLAQPLLRVLARACHSLGRRLLARCTVGLEGRRRMDGVTDSETRRDEGGRAVARGGGQKGGRGGREGGDECRKRQEVHFLRLLSSHICLDSFKLFVSSSASLINILISHSPLNCLKEQVMFQCIQYILGIQYIQLKVGRKVPPSTPEDSTHVGHIRASRKTSGLYTCARVL